MAVVLVKTAWPDVDAGNLRFYLDYLFDGVALEGATVLDVGATCSPTCR